MDAHLKFVTVDVGDYGKQSDGGILRNFALYQSLETRSLQVPEDRVLLHSEITLPHTFVGDEAYLLTTYLIQLYSRRTLDRSKARFNYRLSRARGVVESAFGICASKWRILDKAIETKVDTSVDIMKCISLLHNIIIDFEGYCCLHCRLSQHDSLSLPPTRATREQRTIKLGLLISNFRRVLNVVCFLLGDSPASEIYMPTFRNTLFHLHREVGAPHLPTKIEQTECSETSAYKFQTPGNHPNKVHKLGVCYQPERPFCTLTCYMLRSRTAPFTYTCLSAQMSGRETSVHAGRSHAGHSLRLRPACQRPACTRFHSRARDRRFCVLRDSDRLVAKWRH